MKAIVLAGGKGTRLAPYTTVLPKPLMPLGEQSVLEILIRRLRQYGVREIFLAVGHLSQLIRDYCGDGSQWGVSINYSQEKEPLGTAGPLGLFHGYNEPFLVLNGDLLTDLNFEDLIKHHVSGSPMATIAIYKRQVKLDYGIVEYSSFGKVTGYIEKPEHVYPLSMGAYIIESRAFDFIPPARRFDLPELIRCLVENGETVSVFHHEGYWLDIGRPEDYRQALEEFPAMRDRFLVD